MVKETGEYRLICQDREVLAVLKAMGTQNGCQGPTPRRGESEDAVSVERRRPDHKGREGVIGHSLEMIGRR